MNENTGKRWSQEDIDKLKRMVDGNRPTGIIALELKRSKQAIFSKACSEGISLKPVNRSPYDRKFSNSKKRGKK